MPVDDPKQAYARRRLQFRLIGAKLRGGWMLISMKGRPEQADNWLLIKERDSYARPGEGSVLLDEAPESVVSGRRIETVACEAEGAGAKR